MIQNNRLEYLDSLRGLASISVVLSHFILAYRLDLQYKPIYFSPLHFFFDGFAAVTFFFILSGYVLALSLDRNKSISLSSFYLKRIFRIMPVYIVTISLSLIAYKFFTVKQTIPDAGIWISSFWDKSLDIVHFTKQVVFLHPNNNAELVPQNWSLKIEMLFSFLLPFLYLIYKKAGQSFFFVFILVLYLLFNVPVFIIHFSLGIYLAMNQEIIVKYFRLIRLHFNFILLAVILLLYTYRYTVPMYYYYYFRKHSLILGNEDFTWIITGFGAFLFLIYCISSPRLQLKLNFKPFRFIGKISYSIYLTHMIILILIIPMSIDLLNKIGIFNIYLIWITSITLLMLLTVLISYVLNEFIEIPFGKFGNSLIKKSIKHLESIGVRY